jgi:hypothetical protein
MITRIDPDNFASASTVQIESNAGNPWLALEEIEEWAAAHGFVRTSEYHPRAVLVNGERRFRGICYRVTEEERAAIEQAHQDMIVRGDALRHIGVAQEGTEG